MWLGRPWNCGFLHCLRHVSYRFHQPKESDIKKNFHFNRITHFCHSNPTSVPYKQKFKCLSQLIKSIKSIKFSLKCHRADYFEESLLVLSHTTRSLFIVWTERSETTSIISNNADLCLKIRPRYLTFTSVWLRLINVLIDAWYVPHSNCT